MLARFRYDSDNFDKALSDFLAKQNARFDEITKGIDREAAVNALMKKRGMPKEEAQELVDDALAIYTKAVGKAKKAINDTKTCINEMRNQLEDAAEQARVAADNFSSSMAKSALAAALALILGAVVSIYAGHCGNSYSKEYGAVVENVILDLLPSAPEAPLRSSPDNR